MSPPGHEDGWGPRCSFYPEKCLERKSGSVGHDMVDFEVGVDALGW